MKRLSEFIRLGGMLGPQTFSHSRGPNGGSCALVGAIDAAGICWTDDDAVNAAFPALQAAGVFTCPACCVPSVGGLTGLIIHLNDQHLWARELIADHIERLEQTDPVVGLVTDLARQKATR